MANHPGVTATVNRRNPANQLRLVVYPIIYMFYFKQSQDGCLGFLNPQQYLSFREPVYVVRGVCH